MSVRASSTGLYKEGQKVKVKAPVTLFSVPKHPEGLNIEGMEGTVAKDVSHFRSKDGKDHVLSANLPYVVKFVKPLDGKEVKFQAHLVSGPPTHACMHAVSDAPAFSDEG